MLSCLRREASDEVDENPAIAALYVRYEFCQLNWIQVNDIDGLTRK
jgi:hypothetical protein